MWALRRASNPLKHRGIQVVTSRTCCTKSEVSRSYLEDSTGSYEPSQSICSPFIKRSYNIPRASLEIFMGRRNLSSHAGARSGEEEEDDLEDGFSELETIVSEDKNRKDESEDESEISDADLEDGLELSDTEADGSSKKSGKEGGSPKLFWKILDAPGNAVSTVLEEWVKNENELGRAEISVALLQLRKRRFYGRALQMMEWLEASKHLDYVERDYASRVDLIAKVMGVHRAESYIEKIPKSFRGEVVYRTLLANATMSNKVAKAEQIFNKMKDLEFPISSFACNQLILLYKRVDKKKIADVLLLMEKENVKPTLFTYKLLIDTKGQANDMDGMEQIVATMKAEGIEPDTATKAVLAKHYIACGKKEKAEAVIKEIEGGNNLEENRWAIPSLLVLNATLGKTDEVTRLWELCSPKPRYSECMSAIEAFGKLKKIPEAEAVFQKIAERGKISSRNYAALLKVYANHKMLKKGKELVRQMGESGCKIGPLTWDALVRLYVESGEVEKADSILQKATQQNPVKPMFGTLMAIMDQYAKKGDVHNAEKIFYRLRQVGYEGRLRPFVVLTEAYINAKVPAYGIRERMKADNIFPNKMMAAQLVKVDAFKKTAVSELLD